MIMKLYSMVFLAVAILAANTVSAGERDSYLDSFEFKVPAGWKRVGDKSRFVDKDGYISPKSFDLDGIPMPITVTARRMEREPELTEKKFEARYREFVKDAMEKAKADLKAPDYVGPKVSKKDLEGCGFTVRKVGKKSIYTSTIITADKGDSDESLVTKATSVMYVDGDHIYVLLIIGVIQHCRDYAKEIRALVESVKPKR